MIMQSSRLPLDRFFCEVQYKALRQAELSTKNRDDAMDILQDAMIKLASHYADKESDWPKLFQRILQNLITDHHRRKKVRSLLIWWDQHNEELPLEDLPTDKLSQPNQNSPQAQFDQQQISEKVTQALKSLPLRQQQAFCLRAWWEYDVEETAFAMGCSAGSVKTHYSRALKRLRELLGELDL